MTKRTLKKMYRDYIFNAGKDSYKMKNGDSWEKMVPIFAVNLSDEEREVIHKEYWNSHKECKLAA